MAERDNLLHALIKEVLGPRAGTAEFLASDEDPLDEYITGVLAPHLNSSTEIDGADELVGSDDSAAEEQGNSGIGMQSSCSLASLLSPTLDPRSRPASLGLSFTLQGTRPLVDVCATWGRYLPGPSGGWRRSAFGEIWDDIDCSNAQQLRPSVDDGVRLHILSRKEAELWRISLFLVNATPCADGRPRTEDHLFQPQIRVNCHEGVQLVALKAGRFSKRDEEEQSLELLYRDRHSLARGHLTSAVWRAIDPERPCQDATPSEGPFQWADGVALFEPAVVARFSPADARTEYIPAFPVNSPDQRWPKDFASPQLDPEQLSETWDPEALEAGLRPLAKGFEKWIGDQEAALSSLEVPQQKVAARHLELCQQALHRIDEGINLLVSDAGTDARLAFCLANRAMALQARWTKGRVNRWWPFQLAFQLLNLPALAHREHPDRAVCDLLWFPTGGGKTEAYLGLAAFALAIRRLRAFRQRTMNSGAGVTVLSRYTLRLLTIQQYRRALAVIAALEVLRVDRSTGSWGWRPRQCQEKGDWIWGRSRFSAGLWVGGNVTPNNLQDFTYKDRVGRLITVRGAISILEGRGQGQGEPAQVLFCPACHSVLAIPPDGYRRGENLTLHFVLGDANVPSLPLPEQLSSQSIRVNERTAVSHQDACYSTLSLDLTFLEDATPENVDAWFKELVQQQLGSGSWLAAARPSRPGYFIRTTSWGRRGGEKAVDFEIFCPAPTCDLASGVEWEEQTPCGPWVPPAPFRSATGLATRAPIPAWTVDEQIYRWCPSMVIATVDKFARLSFESRAASLFGNVERYNEHLGFYRRWCPPSGPSGSLSATPLESPREGQSVSVERLDPPDLILQDELHLIEGPLGSMVGIYETAIDALASGIEKGRLRLPKYLASTATVRNAETQVQSLYARSLQVFPPAGITIDDFFFARTRPMHPLESGPPGRLYIGICAPGRGAQTPIVRMWSRLLQHPEERRRAGADLGDLDSFWTLVGYFNAVRELAGAVALSQQDIVQRLATIGTPPRVLMEGEPLELSSRQDSMRLPALLGELATRLERTSDAANLVVATSMFGTGVDVERLGLMVVHGQPKTTSAYIQATGRVGRRSGGLVVTFLRASRPRDLNHYEFFNAFHSALYRYVEPVTVSPFAPRARDRALGPVSVALLRQAHELDAGLGPVSVHERWRVQQRIQRGIHSRAHEMSSARRDLDVEVIPPLIELRSQQQPGLRRPDAGDSEAHAAAELDRWQQLAARTGGRLVFFESTVVNPPSRPVVLGDLAHEVAKTGVAYEEAPNSLRDVEPTVTIRGWR